MHWIYTRFALNPHYMQSLISKMKRIDFLADQYTVNSHALCGLKLKQLLHTSGPLVSVTFTTAARSVCRDNRRLGVFLIQHLQCNSLRGIPIDQLHKPRNVPVPYPTMHHFVTEMCTHVHISVTKWCIVGYLSDALWELWGGSIWIVVQWKIDNVTTKLICNTTGAAAAVVL